MTEALRIRRAGPEDLPRLLALERAIFPHPWSRAMIEAELRPEPERIPLLAFLGDEPVGYAFCWRVADELHLVNLGVLARCRRRGVGRALLGRVLADPAAAGAALMTLEVRRSNEAAIAFYRGQDFRAVAIRPRYYPDTDEDAVIMLRELDSPAAKEPLSNPGSGA